MLPLKKTLKNKLKGADRVAVLGVGSDIRGDDAAGVIVAERLGRKMANRRRKFRVFIGATAPENLTGQIRQFKPSHLIIVDSADFGKPAGRVKLIETQDFGGASFCTHKLPLKIMIEYLVRLLKCEIIVIGIQPKSFTFCSRPTKAVAAAITQVCSAINTALEQ
ncbi:MAG: hydrogenase 3 maturation endopeptidase HyCI [Candidatus Omnitrophota bacterium]